MKSRSKQKTDENILEFYTDYYGNFLKTNGAAYEPTEVIGVTLSAQASSNKNIQSYEIELKNGKRGRLRLNSRAANYMGGSRFIAKCKELLNIGA